MLTSLPESGKLRVARNLLPTAEGSMESRPGARQLVDGEIAAVVPWGNRLLLQREGRLLIWDGALHDVASAGALLDAAPFQGFTTAGVREDRLYVADGVNAPWYIAADGLGSYIQHSFLNETLDPITDEPVPLPVPSAIAFWGSRLWISTGGNFVQHSQNDRPHEWNPLWTIDCQGQAQDRVLGIEAAGDALLVGLSGSIWMITGKSQYDFQRHQVFNYGCAGAQAVTTDGSAPWWMGPHGIRTVSGGAALSAPISDWFTAGVTGGLACDRHRSLILACVNGRALAGHLTSGGWGELCPAHVSGVWASDDRSGWYGADGLWALQRRHEAWVGVEGEWHLGEEEWTDVDLEGAETDVGSVAEWWPEIPASQGNGRALLVRTYMKLRGSTDAEVRYTAIADNLRSSETLWTASDPSTVWGDVNDDLEPDYDDAPLVFREAVPRLDGQRFIHRLQGAGRVELVSAAFNYRVAGA